MAKLEINLYRRKNKILKYAKQHKTIHIKFVLQTLYFVNRKKHGRINIDSSMPKGQ